MASKETSTKERSPIWRFMNVAIGIGILAIGANLLSRSLHLGLGISKS
ncbi:MAG TPA: hypothetical protein VMR34_05845 [Candidatus Saccharimonadales bacterium]|nr:hypothetical protein [Candidatus Saccharimonadales bacterium]